MRSLLPALLLTMMSITATTSSTAAGPTGAPPVPVRMAVLGDSDSHGYQDTLSFAPGSAARGGPHRASTLQWTEVLARLRSSHLDLGPRETTGQAPRLARLAGLADITLRTPPKLDHRHNFAVSGATCDDLNEGRWHQSRSLAALIDKDPQAWEGAVVVIRIGVNSVGQEDALERLAGDADDPQVSAATQACVRAVGEAMERLRKHQPRLRIVLVGLFNNAHWAKLLDRWQDPVQLARIERGIDRFDNGLRELARRPGTAFLDERALFRDLFGGRDGQGRPAYRSRRIGPTLTLSNTAGDAPEHMVVADGHSGTVWNALWANELLGLLASQLQLDVPRLSEAEIAALVGR
jgi:hypothetical protein